MTTAETPSQNFRNLYPEVDPTAPIRLGRGEHLAIVASTGILVFGAAAGDLRVTGAGFALFLLSIIITASKTSRRIRHEARSRFPGEDWIEYRTARRLRTDIIVPVGWLIISAITGACLWYVPAQYTYWGAGVAAVVACVIMLFLPGLSPLWGEPTNTSDDTIFYEVNSVFSEETTSAPPHLNVADTAEYGITGTYNHSN